MSWTTGPSRQGRRYSRTSGAVDLSRRPSARSADPRRGRVIYFGGSWGADDPFVVDLFTDMGELRYTQPLEHVAESAMRLAREGRPYSVSGPWQRIHLHDYILEWWSEALRQELIRFSTDGGGEWLISRHSIRGVRISDPTGGRGAVFPCCDWAPESDEDESS
jgi:hypothetical protein